MLWQRGWSVGTSSNYSVVVRREPLELLITASGKDKGRLMHGDFVRVAANGKPTLPPLLAVLDDKSVAVGGPESRFSMLPKTDTEIDAFIKGLSGTAKLGDADKAVLIRSLKDAAMAPAEAKK